MAAAEVHIEHDPEQERIEAWRFQELERAGFSTRDAADLAASAEVDLHRALDLVARGCSHDLAVKILL